MLSARVVRLIGVVLALGAGQAQADFMYLYSDSAPLQLGSSASGSGLSSAGSSQSNLGSFGITIVPDAGLAANPAALAAFDRAAAQWSQYISDPINITINAGLDSLPANVIGSTSTVLLQDDYASIRNQMVADAAHDPGDSIVASLPTAANASFIVPSGTSLTGNVIVSKANAKALGFTGLDAAFGVSDASITFSSNFNFDYDRSNGITPGTMDFQTVALHEIGHALGFISNVDDLDNGATSATPYALDLFRFNAGQLPTTTSDFATLPRDLVPGDNDYFDDLASLYQFSTGVNDGDGNQASHWKADELTGSFIGVMDPTLAFGDIENATYADLRALDVIGYDIDLAAIPEPSSLAMMLLAFGSAAAPRLKRRFRQYRSAAPLDSSIRTAP